MTIDPTKFEAQGKPSKDVVRGVWEGMNNPSARKVADLLVKRGYAISWRTVARWHETGWAQDKPNTNARKATLASNNSNIARALVQEVREIPQATKDAAVRLANGETAPLVGTPEEIAVANRIAELLLLSETALDVQEAKARRIMNIMLMEQAAKRSHVMTLIPKDTGAFVEAMTDARRVMGTGQIDTPPGAVGNGGAIIDQAMIDVSPPNPTASAIGKFLHSEGMAS